MASTAIGNDPVEQRSISNNRIARCLGMCRIQAMDNLPGATTHSCAGLLTGIVLLIPNCYQRS